MTFSLPPTEFFKLKYGKKYVYNLNTCLFGFPRSTGLLQGAQPHLQELGEWGIGKVCFDAPPTGHPLQCDQTNWVSWAHMEPNPEPLRNTGGVI